MLTRPQAPIDPPRRRSSLHFSKIFSCSPPRDGSDSVADDRPIISPVASMASDPAQITQATPSNTSRKRMPTQTSAFVTPGHVAQMQKLFQSAKASLRVDMAFAASPTGSIDSRLPQTTDSQQSTTTVNRSTPDGAKNWRYSSAPGLLLGLDRDVREPVPEGSPALPEIHTPGSGTSLAEEPRSSGFCNSPVKQTSRIPSPPVPRSSIADVSSADPTLPQIAGYRHLRTLSTNDVDDLDARLERLHVMSADIEMEDFPAFSRAAIIGGLSAADVALPPSRPMSTDFVEDDESMEIFLSEPAKAAAEFAKVKRGVLQNPFDYEIPSRQSSPELDREDDRSQIHTPCPNPGLHELLSQGTCPDPVAHLTPTMARNPILSFPHGYSLPPGVQDVASALHRDSPARPNLQGPAASYQRATSTGSPMPFARIRSLNRQNMISPDLTDVSHQFMGAMPHQHEAREGLPVSHGEHFRPGWYFTKEPARSASKLNSVTYSFSTAAAKSVGQSAAPDSRIRDAYRTDTLTPLAKPPSRFRKTGIAAMASARGVSKYYGNQSQRRRGHMAGTGTRTNRPRSGVHFRSSPPPEAPDLDVGVSKRRRSRDLDEEFLETRDISQALEVDDEVRAAVRMSLMAMDTPDSLRSRGSLSELSPNVVVARKDRRDRKKRRPSYWDGDLKEVRDSPAGRHGHRNPATMTAVRGSVREGAERKVLTSPPKMDAESVRSQSVEIEGKENIGFEDSSSGGDAITMEDVDGTMMVIEKDMCG
jgi:hypothetical protein